MSRVKKKTTTARKTPSRAAPAEEDDKHRWTFLTNHAHVLSMIHMHPEMVLREIALQVGITERAVQRITQELEEAGYLRHERIGRRNAYQVSTNVPLRHPVESHRTIGDLLGLISKQPEES